MLCLSSLPWRIWNCSSSWNTSMRSVCVLWLDKLSIDCLRNSQVISQQSSSRITTSSFFNKLAHYLSFERKWENPCVSLPCTAMRNHSVFKVLNKEIPGFVVGKRGQQCQQTEPEPFGPTLQGIGHGWQCPGTCGSSRNANGHLPTFLLFQHCKDTWKLSLVLYPWICTLYLCMQFSWSMVTSIFWCSWCAYRIHFPCVCPIWSPCGSLGMWEAHEGPAGNSRASAGVALLCTGPCVCNLYYDCAMWYPRCACALLPEMIS